MMSREHCLRALAEVRGDSVVVATYSSAFEWERISPSALNLPATGAMGQGSSHSLGLALGAPNRTIIVLDGDGSLLMNLGSLVTIANAAPKNLIHFVCENGTYEANGSHPIPGKGVVDFAGLARSAGYRHAFSFDDSAAFSDALPKIMSLDGPTFCTLKISPDDNAVNYDYGWMHGSGVRKRFHEAINRR